MRQIFTAALAGAAAMVATPASASLVYSSTASIGAQGFGSAPRALTVQGTGNATTESGCVGVRGSGNIVVGTGGCVGTDAQFDPNGVINAGGQEANPPTDNQKFGIPTVSSLGITSAADIGILFNVTDPGGNGANVTDLTLKFYNAMGGLLGSIDGSYNFLSSATGNGNAGFVFVVSSDEQSYVNGLLGAGAVYTALEATIAGVSGGPESFSIVNLRATPGVPEPATWAMMLIGFGGIGFAMRRNRRSSGRLLQIA